ncbi:penicillin-binding transpeptidase domain-containing protein [Pseudoduganella sp. LjRoot289]|uniref:penicillin-binding transpeptidase domain-containing protein n=1 Tax=Pseudoduganella sp. LjRoot289 TaxID=3342314 RepID=UPI003ECF8087
MRAIISHLLQAMGERQRSWRRRRNLRAGTRASTPAGAAAWLAFVSAGRPVTRAHGAAVPRRAVWLVASGVLAAVLGAVVIVGHARYLGAVTITTADAASASHAAAVYQSALPGATLAVERRAGVRFSAVKGGAVVTLAGMQGMGTVRVDLCSQLRDPGSTRLVPLRLGYRFDDVQRWMASQQGAASGALRNVLVVGGESAATADMPEVRISGNARADFDSDSGEPLQLTWRSAPGLAARWLGDASLGRIAEGGDATVAFRRQGWLAWGEGAAMRIERRASVACPQAGELLVQLYRLPVPEPVAAADGAAAGIAQRAWLAGGRLADAESKVLVAAFPSSGAAVTAYLQAGVYTLPPRPGTALEDQALFLALQAKGLIRLDASGMVAIAPRDLPQWLAGGASTRATELGEWKDVRLDDAAAKLIKRLYYQADGAYVRQQIDIYNSERRLLAWRVKSGPAWEASAGDSPLSATAQMPPAAARLFAELPQGWQPWTRVAYWPQASAASTVRLTINRAAQGPAQMPAAAGASAARPAAEHAGEAVLHLLVAGRVLAVGGASAEMRAACTGRGCGSLSDATQLTLKPAPGAHAVTVDVQPLDMTNIAVAGDQQYRHLRVVAGRLAWLPLDTGMPDAAPAPGKPASPVQLQDRNGTLLWADGGSTPPALDAGLAAMLGVGPGHASSLAGMLARVPAAGGAGLDGKPSLGKLSLDLPLQALSQHILDCIGMQRGRWDGKACTAGRAPPQGRHAGLVILDAETGDILAAAGAGNAPVHAADWSEVRDFERANPARSPLRLPALQHDGGAHRSPGSTFKIVSAVGLELAAKSDPKLDALLGGMPLSAINAIARQRGYAFQTGAATYPVSQPANERRAHITNYKEQSLDRRAQEGKLGLAQAITYSLNTWFAWSSELSDRSLFGRPDGGVPGLQALEPGALDPVRPIMAAAHRLGFEQRLRLDGGLLPDDFAWSAYDALQATPARMDVVHTRHELRQMAIGLRMQATPLQMALVSAAIGQGATVTPRLLLELNGKAAQAPQPAALGVRLDRIRAGMKGVVDAGTAAHAFGGPALAPLRRGLYGKTGTAPVSDSAATVWFTGWLEPGSLPGQTHRLAMAAFVSHSDASGGDHAAPMVAALLAGMAARGGQNAEQRGK